MCFYIMCLYVFAMIMFLRTIIIMYVLLSTNINCFYCKPNCAYTVPEKIIETMIASDCVRMLVNFVCRVASVGYNDRCVADHRTCSFSGGLVI